MKTPLAIRIFLVLVLIFSFCHAVSAEVENLHETEATDAVSLLKRHIAFLEEHDKAVFKIYGHIPGGRHFVLLSRAHLLKSRSEFLQRQIENAASEEERNRLKTERTELLQQLVETSRTLAGDVKAAWNTGTVMINDFLDALELARKANIELLIATNAEQVNRAVQEVFDFSQEEFGTFRGRAEELQLLKQKVPLVDLHLVRLTLFELRYDGAVWRLRHSTFPKPIVGVSQPVWSPHNPEEELNKQIRQHLDDQLRTAKDLVAVTEAAWKAGTRRMTDLAEVLRRKKEVELRILRYDTKPEEAKIVEVLEKHIKQAEAYATRLEKTISVMASSKGTLRRYAFYVNQMRLFAISLKIERLRLRLEYAESEAEKEECREEIGQILDAATEMMQFVGEYVRNLYKVGGCSQKECLDTLERLLRLKMERF